MENKERHIKIKDRVFKYRDHFLVKERDNWWSIYKSLNYKGDMLDYKDFIMSAKSLNRGKRLIDLMHF